MRILNLGCGTKASSHRDMVNIDWSFYLRAKRNPVLRAIVPLLTKGERLRRFRSLPSNVMVHNIARGIPFDDDSVDAVYHSHLLEHLDQAVAREFLIEIKRVLRPGGIQRIVVPDFETACRAYLSHFSVCDSEPTEVEQHNRYIAAVIEQCVRKEAFGTSQQKPFRRLLENRLLGDARRRGETHQWMYDRINLGAVLTSLGYRHIQLQRFDTSLIPDWESYGLDVDEHGNQYKPGSLYVEAVQ